MKYDIVIIGAGPGGIFSAYELAKKSKLKVAVLEEGAPLEQRHCWCFFRRQIQYYK